MTRPTESTEAFHKNGAFISCATISMGMKIARMKTFLGFIIFHLLVKQPPFLDLVQMEPHISLRIDFVAHQKLQL